MTFFERLFGRRGRRAKEVRPPVAAADPERVREVEAVLAELRPLFRADGGDIVLRSIDDSGWVTLKAVGACHGCAVSELTLKGAVKPRLQARCAWFRGVRLG